jgi:hypothetical protein
MLIADIVRVDSNYLVGGMPAGDEDTLIQYLKAKGVTEENIKKALEGLKRDGHYVIQQQ